MKIEVFYLANCPFHKPTVRLLKEVLAAENIKTTVTEVLVVDAPMARHFKLRGSPTVRIDDLDIAEDSPDTGTIACRLYPGSPQVGVPPIDMVRLALARARGRSTT